MNFPGHKYLGPGNSMDKGDPIDTDDAIAKEHDLDYDNAQSKRDVRHADVKAVKNFTVDAIGNANWHSVVGAAGLTTKFAAESVTGVVYPVVPDGDKNKGKKGLIKEKLVDNILEPIASELLPGSKK